MSEVVSHKQGVIERMEDQSLLDCIMRIRAGDDHPLVSFRITASVEVFH
jgi:hypothetical protein